MIEIRLAGARDLEALLPLVRGYRQFYQQTHDASAERATMQGHLRDGSSSVYLAWRGERAVGFVQIFAYWSTVRLAPTLILEDLFVASDARGDGVATRLLERALEHARSLGAAGMFLETAADNEMAQRVYARCGWTREGHFLKYNAPLP
ncbi:MAG TPA: GNAT family N-acetyltransferase [Candidatus Baltobacteraceae bacterium]|nr:GNAT family N-acetyltransferase [Candidatus Baltobacteraceae bacterium]